MQSSLLSKGLSSKFLPGDWLVEQNSIDYPIALEIMENRVRALDNGQANELYWLLEHPPLYTSGSSANIEELKDANRFPVYEAGRGGRYTYHGPGQRIIYVMSDLKKRQRDIKQHVCRLEEWVLRTLHDLGIRGERKEGRIGIWVMDDNQEKKIAAIGVRVRRWITYHGLSFNVNPNLSHFSGIVPCGLSNYGVTSLHNLGIKATMEEVDKLFFKHGQDIFTE